MIKKLFSIFLEILVKVLQIRPILRILKRYKILILIIFAGLFIALVLWLRTFSLLDILNYKKQIFDLIQDKPLLTVVSFFFMYVLVATISFPGTTVFSIMGGFLFGLTEGVFICLFAVSIGSCFSFLITRYFLKDFFMKKAGSKLEKIYNRLKKDEVYYLFAFRLFPFTPLFFTNMLMGLTSMRLIVFFTASFIAFLPTIFIYVNMGSQLSELEDWSGFTDPDFLLASVLMGVFPLVVKYSFKFLKRFRNSEEELPLESGQVFLK